MKNNLSKQLDLIYQLQQKYKDLHVGGSIGLHLHGVKLSRFIGSGDIDLCKAIDDINQKNCKIEHDGSSEHDFDYSFEFQGIKIELNIDNKQAFDIIEVGGKAYRVSKLETIVYYKKKYANKGYEKHANDLLDIELFLKQRKLSLA
jgi:hypothetical protein